MIAAPNNLIICKIAHLSLTSAEREEHCAAYREACEDALRAVNGRASSFAVTRHSELVVIAERAERKMEKRGVAKAERAGASVAFRPAGPAAKSYRYKAKTTMVQLGRNTTSWFLTSAQAIEISPGSTELFKVFVTESAAQQIIRGAFDGFEIADLTIVRHLAIYGAKAHSAMGRLPNPAAFASLEANPHVVNNGVFITPFVLPRFALFSEDRQALQEAMTMARLSGHGVQFDPIKPPAE